MSGVVHPATYDTTPPANVSITATPNGAAVTLTWSADASIAGLHHDDVDMSAAQAGGACARRVCVSRSHVLGYTLLVDIDRELKQTLEQLLELCRQFDVHLRLIGGLAVRGFARRKRFTHDIDLAISRHDKPNLIAILKRMGFDYQDLTQFEGVKATRRIGDTVVEIHISVERLWDMSSNQTYTLSADSAEIPIDDARSLLAPAVSVQDLLILKLMPLRDRDMGDVIALLLDAPAIDARAFWANCERTGNTSHIAAQLTRLENALRSGDFRQAWADFYGEPLAAHDVLVVLEQVHSLLKVKR